MSGSFENPDQIIRSWGNQGSYSSGRVVSDKLVPEKFRRIRTPFVQTWREETLNNSLDWGSQAFSYLLPKGLRVISSMFLKIDLPAVQTTKYKLNPGMYAIKTVRFLSAGQEAYHVDVAQYLRDYLESLSDEHYGPFTRTYLGNEGGTGTTGARTVLVPIMLSNSAYLNRSGSNLRGRGVFPCLTGENQLEIQITMAAAADVCEDDTAVPASIAGACSMMFHQVEMTPEDLRHYQDARGSYSIVTRRFTEVTNGYQAASANTKVSINHNQPVGIVTELLCIATPTGTTEAHRQIESCVRPVHFAIIADSVTQKSLNSKAKVDVELWSNGFIGNSSVDVPGRLCFAAHAAEAENVYTGGFNMRQSGQITIEITFAEAVDYRIYAIQLQRISKSPLGHFEATLN